MNFSLKDLLPYKILIDRDLFFEYTKIDLMLDEALPVNDKGIKQEAIELFFLEVAENVYNYLSKEVTISGLTNEMMMDIKWQPIIAMAQLMQAKYMYENGNSIMESASESKDEVNLNRGKNAYSDVMINYLDTFNIRYRGI